MEWPGDLTEDQALVAALVPNMSNEMDTEKFLRNTKEKLTSDGNRLVRLLYMSAKHLIQAEGEACPLSGERNAAHHKLVYTLIQDYTNGLI